MSKNDNSETMISSIDTEDIVSEEDNYDCIYNDLLDDNNDTIFKIVPNEERKTKNKLTRYEFVRVIGERTKQLIMGAKPLILQNKKSEQLDYNEIAIEELKLKMLPFKIKRPLINKYEIWNLDELSFKHLENLF